MTSITLCANNSVGGFMAGALPDSLLLLYAGRKAQKSEFHTIRDGILEPNKF
jgi:hypothetical protein